MAGILVLAGASSSAAMPPASAQAASRISASGNPATTASPAAPVDIVIAVDESASIEKSDLALEQAAAQLVVLGEIAPESKIGVLGFGGDNGQYNAQTNRQLPVDPVCPMTEVDTPKKVQSLINCIGKLHKRSPLEGDHTDLIDAINQGVADLIGTRDAGRSLLLFLLTDGYIDMVDTPGFPGSSSQANEKGNQVLLTTVLPWARAHEVRIWPLGLGAKLDDLELHWIAAGGYQGSCNSAMPDATPHPITGTSEAQVEGKLFQVLADAQCLQHYQEPPVSIPPGGSANLYVTVPDIATAGSIEVIRKTPQISVTYFDPDNQEVPGPAEAQSGQTFSLAGTDGPVESLLVGNPIPGHWRIYVAARPGLTAKKPVTVSVLFQGVLHFDIVADPADPAPGQTMAVSVKLQVRTRPLSSSDLHRVHVSVRVTGPGLAEPISVPVNDTSRDGVYNGTFTVPRSATGPLTVVGVVSAQGVLGDTQYTLITVDRNGQLITGRMMLPSDQVAQGGQVTGTLQLSNPTGLAHTIRLVPVDTPPGVIVTPSTITLPAARATSRRFTVHFADSVPVGLVTGHINAIDAVTGLAYAQAAIGNTVIRPQKTSKQAGQSGSQLGNADDQWWPWLVFAIGMSIAVFTLRRAREKQ